MSNDHLELLIDGFFFGLGLMGSFSFVAFVFIGIIFLILWSFLRNKKK